MSEHEPNQHDGISGAVDKAQDLVGGAVGLASASTAGAHSTEAFVENAVQSNRYEIEAAQIALERTGTQTVRGIAQQMIEDHERLGRRFSDAVSAAGLDVARSPQLDQRRQGMIDNLKSATPQDFDGRYLDQQDLAHREAVTLFEGYAEHGDEETLKAAAREALPTLREHLERVRGAKGH